MVAHDTRANRPQTALIAIIVVLMLALVASLSAATYMWRSAGAWRADSAAWEDQARQQAADVAQLNYQLENSGLLLSALESEYGSVQTELGSVTDRLTSLAGEKALLGDENAIRQQFAEQQQQYLESHAQLTKDAAYVADSLAACTTGQTLLIGYQDSADHYDPAAVAAFKTQVSELCTQAQAAVTALHNELAAAGVSSATPPTLGATPQPTLAPAATETAATLPITE